MDKIKLESSNIADENFEKLASLFPNVVTETIVNDRIERAIDVEKLKQEINAYVLEGNEERYNFTWPDKRKSVVLANAPTRNTLRACKEESKDFDNTENLYIEGDNLEVLKLLRNTYMGKVKMIYIDPPYNTGNDFIYQDNFYINKEDYLEMSGQFDEEGNRLFENTEANGRFHTDWLNMMYPRLKMARDLLTDDGVVFISINDNELENLTKICNEIFGEKNFIAQFNIITGANQAGEGVLIQKNIEYAVCYAKKIYNTYINRVDKTNETWRNLNDAPTPLSTRLDMGYTLYYNPITEHIIPIHDYDKDKIYLNNIEYVYTDNQDLLNKGYIPIRPGFRNGILHRWRWGIETCIERISELRIFKDNDKYIPKFKQSGFNPPKNIQEFSVGTNEIKDLFKHSVFSYPKSIKYLKYLVSISTDYSSLILDFFSGSATTANAVMQLNAEDGGNRKYIMVQLPAETPEDSEARKAGYNTICEIGKERIRRAGEKIKKDYPNANIDTGFRVFKLDSSNMEDVYYEAEKLSQQDIYKTISYIKADRSEEDLLFQIILSCGIPLKCKIEIKKVNNRDVYFVDDKYLIVCFEKDIDDNTIEELAKMQPDFMVFNQNVQDSTLANIKQIFKMISNDTNVKVI